MISAKERGIKAMAKINGFTVWDKEYEKQFLTEEEINESNMYAQLICAFVEARKEKGLTQKDIERMTGVKQPQIARMEKGEVSPTVANMIKVLAAMGKKLTIVPI